MESYKKPIVLLSFLLKLAQQTDILSKKFRVITSSWTYDEKWCYLFSKSFSCIDDIFCKLSAEMIPMDLTWTSLVGQTHLLLLNHMWGYALPNGTKNLVTRCRITIPKLLTLAKMFQSFRPLLKSLINVCHGSGLKWTGYKDSFAFQSKVPMWKNSLQHLGPCHFTFRRKNLRVHVIESTTSKFWCILF